LSVRLEKGGGKKGREKKYPFRGVEVQILNLAVIEKAGEANSIVR